MVKLWSEPVGFAVKVGQICVCFGILTTLPTSREQVLKCPSAEVRSIQVLPKIGWDVPLDAKQEAIEAIPSRTRERNIAVVVSGPVLGSMDSEQLMTDLACSPNGLVLTVTISRSANYHGAVTQNVFWFPKITIAIAPFRPDITFQAAFGKCT